MQASVERQKVHFVSGDTTCAAWHYPGTNGACVIMAGGLAVTKEPGTDRFARRFHDAGFTALAFDYRHLGESGGQPRQIMRISEQLADWQAAIAFARTLPEVDATKVALWGFSLSGGHIFRVAARNPDLAAAIAQTPLADGPAAAPNAMRHQTQIAALRFAARGVLDACCGLVGRSPLLVPLAGEPGTVTSLTTPDARNGAGALNPDNSYPHWQQEIAARSALRVGFYRPGRYASDVRCPLQVLAYDDDGAALPGPAVRAAQRAPRGELVRLPGGHYEPFMDGHDQAVDIQLSFLRRHVLDRSTTSPAPAPSALPSGGRRRRSQRLKVRSPLVIQVVRVFRAPRLRRRLDAVPEARRRGRRGGDRSSMAHGLRSALDAIRPLEEEVTASRPGDDLIPEPHVVMDRAFTLDAPVAAVWPWLVQLGQHRSGWYLPRRIERLIPPRRRALRAIDPDLQHLQAGDVIADWGGRDATFEVVELRPPLTLVHRSRRGQTNLSWAINLAATSASTTRVHLRLRMSPVKRRWLVASAGELVDRITIAGLAAGLRERIRPRSAKPG